MTPFILVARRIQGIEISPVDSLSSVDDEEMGPDYFWLNPLPSPSKTYQSKVRKCVERYKDTQFILVDNGSWSRDEGWSDVLAAANVEALRATNGLIERLSGILKEEK